MNYQHPTNEPRRQNPTRNHPATGPQPDPELALAESHASTWKTALVFAAMIFAIVVVLYGINNQRAGMEHTASTPTANAPAQP